MSKSKKEVVVGLDGVVERVCQGLQDLKGFTPFNIMFGVAGYCDEAIVKAVADTLKVPYVLLPNNGFQILLTDMDRQVIYKSSDGMTCNLCGVVLKDRSLAAYEESLLLRDFLALYPKVKVFTYSVGDSPVGEK